MRVKCTQFPRALTAWNERVKCTVTVIHPLGLALFRQQSRQQRRITKLIEDINTAADTKPATKKPAKAPAKTVNKQ